MTAISEDEIVDAMAMAMCIAHLDPPVEKVWHAYRLTARAQYRAYLAMQAAIMGQADAVQMDKPHRAEDGVLQSGTDNEVNGVVIALRYAIKRGSTRIRSQGQTWVRADAGSPDEWLMQTRARLADLTTESDVKDARIAELESCLLELRLAYIESMTERGYSGRDLQILGKVQSLLKGNLTGSQIEAQKEDLA